jgi:hypothetical protein
MIATIMIDTDKMIIEDKETATSAMKWKESETPLNEREIA